MSKEFVTIKVEADYKVKHEQKAGAFEGECIITVCDTSLKDKQFFDIFPRGIFLGYNHEKGTPYVKGLVECCINQLYGAVMALDKMTPYNERKTVDEVDIEMSHQLRMIAQLLVWISNSTSWREGKYHFFDAIEIEKQLEHIKGMCNFYERKEGEDNNEG
jgi:hypothetical protein